MTVDHSMSMKSSTPILDAGPPMAWAGDEIEQYALAEQIVHANKQVKAEAKDEREDYAAAFDQGPLAQPRRSHALTVRPMRITAR